MPVYKSSVYDIYVPRYIGETKNHVMVRLTLLHDRQDIDLKKEPLLQAASECLSAWPILPDKCAITLSITDILLHIIEQNLEMVESWRFEKDLEQNSTPA